MNLTYFKTRNYEQKTTEEEPIKQTQSNPIYGEPVEPSNPISWTSAAKTYAEAAKNHKSKIINHKWISIYLLAGRFAGGRGG